MPWIVIIDFAGDPNARCEVEVPTPHLHVAIDSALFKAGISSAREGSVQITARHAPSATS